MKERVKVWMFRGAETSIFTLFKFTGLKIPALEDELNVPFHEKVDVLALLHVAFML